MTTEKVLRTVYINEYSVIKLYSLVIKQSQLNYKVLTFQHSGWICGGVIHNYVI